MRFKRESSFRSFCSGSAALLLLPDLIQDKSQAGDRSQEGTQNLSHQSILAGQLAETIQLVSGQHRAFHDTALDGQDVLVLLGELADDTSRGDGVAGGAGHGGGAVENLREVITGILSGKPGQSVLNNTVLDLSLPELLPQSGVLSHGDTLVVHKNDGSSFLDLTGQIFHNSLLAFQNLCVGHEFSPPKMKKCLPAKRQKDTQINFIHAPRQDLLQTEPAVFGNS